MSLDSTKPLISEPTYFHREYTHDLPQDKAGNYYIDQCKRATTVALPFLSLYKPLSYPLALTLGGARSVSSLANLISQVKDGDAEQQVYALFQTTLSVAALSGTLLAHPLGMLVTTTHDAALDCLSIGNRLYEGEFQQALEHTAKLINNTLYLALFLGGGIEITIASLAMQVLLGLYYSHEEFQKGKYLESTGHLLMSLIRTNQLISTVKVLQLNRELAALLSKRVSREQDQMQSQKNDPSKGISKMTCIDENGTSEEKSNHKTAEVGTSLFITADQTKQEETIFFDALRNGDLNQSKSCLSKGINIYALDPWGRSTLSAAVQSGNIDVVKLVIKAGYDVNTHYGSGKTIIHDANLYESPNILKYILDLGVDITLVHKDTPSPLHLAICNLESVKLMIEWGADINVTDIKGLTIMHKSAAEYRSKYADGSEGPGEKILFFLLELGADVNIKSNSGETAFDVLNQKVHLIKPDIIQAFVNRGIDLNQLSPISGTNILHRAVETINIDLIESLVSDHKMDIDEKTREGYTPFQLGIIKHGDLDVLEMLLKYHAAINARDFEERTALTIAMEVRQNIIQWLINRGATS